MFIAQTLAEYGLLNSIAAGFNAARYRIEMYIGTGNSTYLLLAGVVVVLLLLTRRRRVRRLW